MNEISDTTTEAKAVESQGDKLLDFGTRVSRYFLDFLETDFKRQQAPRRRVVLKNDAGQLVAFALRKYDRLYRDVLAALKEPSDGLYSIQVARGKYTARISPTLRNLIQQQVEAFPEDEFLRICARVLQDARDTMEKAVDDPERWVEAVKAAFEDAVAHYVVHPLLALLEGPLQQHAYNVLESVFEIETELVEALTRETAEQLAPALNTLLVSGSMDRMEAVFSEFFEVEQCRRRLIDYFEIFAASDAYQEIRDIHSFARRAGDNFQLYLYVCDLNYRNNTFPLFYIAATVSQAEEGAAFTLDLDSRVFVNKAAVDWIAQETQVSGLRLTMNPIEDRIIYVKAGSTPISEMERVLGRVQALFDLDAEVKVGEGTHKVGRSAELRLSNSGYFAACDRSDEALLNDYEALLRELQGAGGAVADLFTDVVKGIILEDPARSDSAVDNAWDQISVPDRLVAETPIPLNEEQRKILAALGREDVRFLTVQGPPGTGKSHTITAVAFESILKGKTVLILSDKMEALDVVEDKLTKAINSVRVHDSFQNPILRLGRHGGTYTKLLTQASVDKIRTYHRAAKSQAGELRNNIQAARERLRANIAGQVEHLSAIRIDEIRRLHEVEASVERLSPDAAMFVRAGAALPQTVDAPSLRRWLATDIGKAVLADIEALNPTSVSAVAAVLRRLAAGQHMDSLRTNREALRLVKTVDPDGHVRVIEQFVMRYEALKLPLIGWLFRGGALRALNAEVGQALPVTTILDLHKRLGDLRAIAASLPSIASTAKEWGLQAADIEWLFEAVVHQGKDIAQDAATLSKAMAAVLKVFPQLVAAPWADRVGQQDAPTVAEVIGLALDLAEFASTWATVSKHEREVPQYDYVADRGRLEQLYATQMTYEMDSRFLSFVESSATTAKTLSSVIRRREKFPVETFSKLRDAFPCIIAGIREFAEYIPLERDMFDLVIIDEASQVSVAQAFPALLRAKKVLVLGDQRQFSNVKSAQASKETNATYTAALQQFFRSNVSDASDKLVRASMFDVKRSVLEFFDLIANYTTMLKKHFRGYQELISFSSQYFYGGSLQAIKVRGKPIDEVIQITVLDHDGRKERYRNTNSLEAEFLREELDALLEDEDPPSVGIITPFREQVTLLNKELFNGPNGREYERALRLKIMTFDTCQGEEREIIYYSMVATPAQDALNYVLPVNLDGADDKVEEALKYQRLNVGLSRAQECMHFVLSKPIKDFTGSVRTVLHHYDKLLNDRSMPDATQVDPNSPMEAKVLGWLKAAPFVQKHQDRIEVQAQFPIGDYLRQLDPFYKHPAYRSDFLLVYRGDAKPVNVIIEYDGFQEHFSNTKAVHDGNWAEYYKPEDIERQMVIESYGYKFLRLNRFNVGSDPVETLSRRLSDLIAAAEDDDDHALVTTIQGDANALASGDKRMCAKCGQIKDAQDFFDPALKSGKGGYGRNCMPCKAPAAKQPAGPRAPSASTSKPKLGRKRRWRRY